MNHQNDTEKPGTNTTKASSFENNFMLLRSFSHEHWAHPAYTYCGIGLGPPLVMAYSWLITGPTRLLVCVRYRR